MAVAARYRRISASESDDIEHPPSVGWVGADGQPYAPAPNSDRLPFVRQVVNAGLLVDLESDRVGPCGTGTVLRYGWPW
ncbi:hypothetical protein GCM10022225_10730 [Plantactinospora mayteni]|uniref:Resolvase/invertase-type recombinase catalytic domain-containing protein n=1 Tax=Plantactinospora mayteni TaxID=566021 RepID=A0ABQ4EHI2_9ACTN|nr:hypothetical protein Pma05_07490 [Plantactinospora mayteni]